MRSFAPRSIAIALASALAITSLPFGAAQAAPAKQTQAQTANAGDAVTDLSARRRYYRGGYGYRHHRGNGAALGALAVIGTIGAIAAAQERRRYYDYNYGYRGYRSYGYGPYYRY